MLEKRKEIGLLDKENDYYRYYCYEKQESAPTISQVFF